VANYNVDIAVGLKGAQKLTSFNKTVKNTTQQIEGLNQRLKNAAKDQNLLVRSFENLNKVLGDAKTSFNVVASGTNMQKKAARELVVAERNLNKEYQQREKLLESIRRNQSGFAQFSRGASQVSSPTVFDTASQKSIDRNRRNQNRIAGRSSVPFGPQPFIGPLPMQGPMFGPMQGPNPMMTVNNNPRILRNLEASRISREASGFGIRPGTQYDRPIGPAFSAVMKSQLRHQKKIDKNTGKTAQLLSASKGIASFGDSNQYASPIGPMPKRQSRFDQLRGQFAQGGMFGATKGQRIKGAASNALIGGGFPLLFGQGALGAAGGGIGGALGGALGGGFGFGLSIAGTAIAQQIQQTLDFRKSIRELNKEMQNMGISSNISGSQVRQLGKSLGITKEEAVKALQEFKRFGDNAVLFAEKFGGDFAKFDAIAQANTVQSALAAIRKINKDLTLDDELRFINSVRRLGVEETINQMLDEMLEKEKKLKTGGFGQGEGKNAGANRKRLGQLNQEKNATQELVDKNQDFIEGLTKVRDQFIQNRDAAEAANRGIRKGLEDVNAEIRKLNDNQFQIVELSKTLGSSFSESFKGIIKGTMSVGEAFRNMFMRIADHFLDMAAQMMAAQISKGFLGMFGSMFGGGFNGLSLLDGMANPFSGPPSPVSPFLGFANGGRPPVGKPSIVGERGPELFTPGISGTITPNEMLGGSTNIVVNVDASGSSAEGDEEQGRQLGLAISAAVQSELIQQKRPGGLLA
jgi:hypothetical protein